MPFDHTSYGPRLRKTKIRLFFSPTCRGPRIQNRLQESLRILCEAPVGIISPRRTSAEISRETLVGKMGPIFPTSLFSPLPLACGENRSNFPHKHFSISQVVCEISRWGFGGSRGLRLTKISSLDMDGPTTILVGKIGYIFPTRISRLLRWYARFQGGGLGNREGSG